MSLDPSQIAARELPAAGYEDWGPYQRAPEQDQEQDREDDEQEPDPSGVLRRVWQNHARQTRTDENQLPVPERSQCTGQVPAAAAPLPAAEGGKRRVYPSP